MAYDGLRMGTFHLCGHPKCSIHDHFCKSTLFDPFWIHLPFENRAFSGHFWDFRRAKMGKYGLEMCCGGEVLGWHGQSLPEGISL